VSEYEKEEASSTKTAEERAFEAKDFNSKVKYDWEIVKRSLEIYGKITTASKQHI
jgi:hypothetical protein